MWGARASRGKQLIRTYEEVSKFESLLALSPVQEVTPGRSRGKEPSSEVEIEERGKRKTY